MGSDQGWVYMALDLHPRGRALRALVLVMACATVATVGLVSLPPARAAFVSMDVSPGQYTGTNVYIPGETMTIVITASPGDSFDLTILNYVAGTPSQPIPGQTVGSSGTRTITWSVPTNWADGTVYRVEVRYAGQTALLATYHFTIQQYAFAAFVGRAAYLPGDKVNISWAATLIKDGSPAPDGVGAIQVWDQAGTTSLNRQVNFTASQGSFTFTLGATVATNQRARVYAWFNDTTGLRTASMLTRFWIFDLGVLVQADKGTYIPGDVVTVSIWTKASPNPLNPSTFDYAAPDIPVDVTVNDLSTGLPVAAYGKTGLTTDASGVLQ